jgi:hypothetical protein
MGAMQQRPCTNTKLTSGPGYPSRYSESLSVRGLNSGGGENFRARPDRSWGSPRLL